MSAALMTRRSSVRTMRSTVGVFACASRGCHRLAVEKSEVSVNTRTILRPTLSAYIGPYIPCTASFGPCGRYRAAATVRGSGSVEAAAGICRGSDRLWWWGCAESVRTRQCGGAHRRAEPAHVRVGCDHAHPCSCRRGWVSSLSPRVRAGSSVRALVGRNHAGTFGAERSGVTSGEAQVIRSGLRVTHRHMSAQGTPTSTRPVRTARSRPPAHPHQRALRRVHPPQPRCRRSLRRRQTHQSRRRPVEASEAVKLAGYTTPTPFSSTHLRIGCG